MALNVVLQDQHSKLCLVQKEDKGSDSRATGKTVGRGEEGGRGGERDP